MSVFLTDAIDAPENHMIVALLLFAPLALTTAPARACSPIIPVPTPPATEGATYLTAVALRDTVFAGAGSVKYQLGEGHFGTASVDRRVYGQLARVDSLGGAGAREITKAFGAAGNRTVVLVPWDYSPSCATTLWGGSARWIARQDPAFFELKLRARDHWAGEFPTFDVFRAGLEPYGQQTRRMSGGEFSPATMLTPSQLFALYRAVPDSLRGDWNAQATAMERWLAANRQLAGKYPADFLPAVIQALREAAQEDTAAIRAARYSQNAAIARGDLSAVARFWTEDVTVRAGLGRALSGKEAYLAAFVADSAMRYERIPTEIVLSSRWPLAYEAGKWEGRARSAQSDGPVLRGRYSAQWVKAGSRWLIRSEVFVALECAEAACRWPAAVPRT
jgi:ketosteroid isomerase-like protein